MHSATRFAARLAHACICSRTVKAATEKIRTDQQQATNTIQTLSTSIHAREMELSKRRQELKDKEALEQNQVEARDNIGKLEKQSKVRLRTLLSTLPI